MPETINFPMFEQAIESQNDTEALSIGRAILIQLEQKYRGNIGFQAYNSKLNAAEFLANQMQQQLKKATNAKMFSVANDLFEKNDEAVEKREPLAASAKSFYETSIKIFSMPVNVDDITNEEKSFLLKYYNLKMLVLTSEIAKAGKALTISEPSFKGTHDYVLVLPLLHASEQKSINTDILPRWMQQPDQLDIFADSCLLHFGFPFHAMNLAKRSAELRNRPFLELNFYKSSTQKCGTSNANTAAECLQRAIDHASEQEPEGVVPLQFEVVQLWLDSKNYPLAAGEAQKIFNMYPDHEESGKAIWLYYYALSRSNSIDQILTDIDNALDDSRCQDYRPKLMYIKWWALRRQRDQAARVAALEHELIKQYGNDPMVAPILLSRATDLLASQNYTGAYESLTQLVEKFPTTAAAKQAKRMIDKLSVIEGNK
jgi:outer membrane protein assembly factor BamD (BamD/ComL family)